VSSSWKKEIAINQTNSLKLPREPPAIIESNRVPAYWPFTSNNDSLITVEDLEIKYVPDLLAVLRTVSFYLEGWWTRRFVGSESLWNIDFTMFLHRKRQVHPCDEYPWVCKLNLLVGCLLDN